MLKLKHGIMSHPNLLVDIQRQSHTLKWKIMTNNPFLRIKLYWCFHWWRNRKCDGILQISHQWTIKRNMVESRSKQILWIVLRSWKKWNDNRTQHITGRNTWHWITRFNSPKGKKVIYARTVIDIRPENKDPNRVESLQDEID